MKTSNENTMKSVDAKFFEAKNVHEIAEIVNNWDEYDVHSFTLAYYYIYKSGWKNSAQKKSALKITEYSRAVEKYGIKDWASQFSKTLTTEDKEIIDSIVRRNEEIEALKIASERESKEGYLYKSGQALKNIANLIIMQIFIIILSVIIIYNANDAELIKNYYIILTALQLIFVVLLVIYFQNAGNNLMLKAGEDTVRSVGYDNKKIGLYNHYDVW
jgi:hypothetical protein